VATQIDMSDEEQCLVPLQDQRVFGAGLKRKRVNFIPEASTSTIQPAPSRTVTAENKYLSIVFKDSPSDASDSNTQATVASSVASNLFLEEPQPQLCGICHLPVQLDISNSVTSRPHEASIAHQVCLSHSHPPSHINRARPGLKYLSSYGWDPDSRLGLGVTGDGIRTPIKPKLKNDTGGLGTDLKGAKRVTAKQAEKLDAGKVREDEERRRMKGEKLNEIFYRNDDVERYLGGN
ncbi:hypothetical protein MMC32_008168, partial [Xylographa parallela]|nr:hypothetical protein [Xylographa parallela]